MTPDLIYQGISPLCPTARQWTHIQISTYVALSIFDLGISKKKKKADRESKQRETENTIAQR